MIRLGLHLPHLLDWLCGYIAGTGNYRGVAESVTQDGAGNGAAVGAQDLAGGFTIDDLNSGGGGVVAIVVGAAEAAAYNTADAVDEGCVAELLYP